MDAGIKAGKCCSSAGRLTCIRFSRTPAEARQFRCLRSGSQRALKWPSENACASIRGLKEWAVTLQAMSEGSQHVCSIPRFGRLTKSTSPGRSAFRSSMGHCHLVDVKEHQFFQNVNRQKPPVKHMFRSLP